MKITLIVLLSLAVMMLTAVLGFCTAGSDDLSERVDTLEIKLSQSLAVNDSVILELATLQEVVDEIEKQRSESAARWKEVSQYTNAAANYYAATVLFNTDPTVRPAAALQITAVMAFSPLLAEVWESVLAGAIPTWMFDMLLNAHLFKAVTEAADPTVSPEDGDPAQMKLQ